MSDQVLLYLQIAFWVLLFLLVHCYGLFPVTLPFVSELFKRRRRDEIENFELPHVSLLISAYNEEAVIERKIQNILEIDYPKEKLEVLIGDDGSADKTAEIVARYADRGITLVKAPKNAGKAAMLNRLQKIASGEILVFCDANTMFFPNVVRKLVAPFKDKKIGCTCGHLILSDKSGSVLGRGESSYWDLESEIKKFEGILDRLMGGNGALYAIRKELYTELPTKKSIMDDFFITTKILQKGFFCTFIASAIGTEQTSKEGEGEYRRKVRIGRANFNYLLSYLPLLNPFKPLLAYLFLSHKFLRWFSPHIVILLFILNALLLTSGPVYQATFAIMVLVLLVCVTKVIPSAYYFMSMNIAMLKGFFLSFCREKSGGWAREARSDDDAPATVGAAKLLPLIAAGVLALSSAPANAFTVDVQGGVVNHISDITEFNLNVYGHWWYAIDQMLFVGVGSGYQEIDNDALIPLSAAAWIRLPIGGQTLPVVVGDFGYLFGGDHQMFWRAGGGFDIKNGDYSSILLMGGYEFLDHAGKGYVYLQAGILIEL
ncbi:glycosyltransferase family 2 protein [Fibrobacter sp. UWP2]|jgi:cellulose synthase/poly-beta-1,6-N-acetylglucosamine synthase-like glycosyltransferase|uniref:glycosyltransferase family 2 protein n=1 Tax=Fibrobacter sp. UWP2 TaxID=1896216 RepID=UPI00091BF76F|nr:glycosyltransferase family 2 protein [Fibrobacter sp. UWP2]SHI54352.1 Glycosyltransferase, catalytic subunit of cellulose synthase and poly-beta-1,6-N-acetylglucosamine synthase [Fibrobacter sp. UWP2]